MKNVEVKAEQGKLVPSPASSPKASRCVTVRFQRTVAGDGMIATTEGNVDIPGVPDTKFGLNVYRRKSR